MALQLANVSKRYWLHGPAPRTLQQALGQMFSAFRRNTPFWALRDFSLTIHAGESVGLIGHNGAGKSTLLRLICGLGRPTTGQIVRRGRITALLELGAGFHPHLTGRENLYVAAIVSGMRRAEVEHNLPAIVDFAEIEGFLDEPLRTYSAGMQMRLAFSVAIFGAPEILIVDEVLAVGDAHFQQKCLARLQAFRQQGKTLLMVSHDTQLLRQFCDRVLWLEHGQLKADGPAENILAAYEASLASFPTPAENLNAHT